MYLFQHTGTSHANVMCISSKREFLEYLEARADQDLSARASIASVGAKIVGDSLGDAAKKGILGGIGSLVGGTVLGKLFGDDDKCVSIRVRFSMRSSSFADYIRFRSKREFLEYIQARSHEELAARASIASVGAKIVGDSLGDAAKKGILGGIGSLVGGTVLGKLFGDDKCVFFRVRFSMRSSSFADFIRFRSKREFLEYIQARSHEELAARAAAGGVAKAGAKVVGDSLGDAAKKGIIGGLGGILGTGIISKIFGSDRYVSRLVNGG